MDIPVRFPSAREKLAQEVAWYRAASAAERLQAVFDLYELCESLRNASPRRRRQLELLAENEAAEEQAWKDFIRRHAGK
jgi:hypothetical protein